MVAVPCDYIPENTKAVVFTRPASATNPQVSAEGFQDTPALIYEKGPHTGLVMVEFELSEEERVILAGGGRVRLYYYSGGAGLRPLKLKVAWVLPLELVESIDEHHG